MAGITGVTDRRAGAQADGAHVRRLEGLVAWDPHDPPQHDEYPWSWSADSGEGNCCRSG